jgi:methionyl-tRNA synthetase
MDKLRVADAISEIFTLFKRCNKYIDETEPWVLAKDEAKSDRLATVLYNLVEGITVGACLLKSFMPETAEKILAQLNSSDREMDDLNKFGIYKSGDKVTEKPQILFARLDPKETMDKVMAMTEAAKPKEEPKPEEKKAEEYITIDDFCKVQMKVGFIEKCERVEGSSKLLKSSVRIGNELRTIASGIAKWYSPEEMTGKKVVVVTNLAPRKMLGGKIVSEGMIIAAEDSDGNLSVLTVDKDVKDGAEIS